MVLLKIVNELSSSSWSSSSTNCIKYLKSLKCITFFNFFSYLLTNSLLAQTIADFHPSEWKSVLGILFSIDELFICKEIFPFSFLCSIDNCVIVVNKYSSGLVLSSLQFFKDSLASEVIILYLFFDLATVLADAMLDAIKLPHWVSHLDTSLSDVNWYDFTFGCTCMFCKGFEKIWRWFFLFLSLNFCVFNFFHINGILFVVLTKCYTPCDEHNNQTPEQWIYSI